MATDVQISLPQTEQPLAVWEKVEILVGDDDQAGHYMSRIEDITNEGIIVSTPEFVDGVARLREGCELRVLITRDEAVYQFNARARTFTVQGSKLYLLSGPSHFRRVQRRQFVRLELVENLTCAIIKSGKNAHYRGDVLTWSDARMINISGGGVMMKSRAEVPVGTIVLLKSKFFLEIGLPVTIAAVCRRNSSEQAEYFIGLEFLRKDRLSTYFDGRERKQLPESIQFYDLVAQNKMVSYVFKQQIDLRKKGLI